MNLMVWVWGIAIDVLVCFAVLNSAPARRIIRWIRQTPPPPPPPTPEECAAAHAMRLAEIQAAGAPERAARAVADEADRANFAARVAAQKASDKAAKAASSAAYLKTHGPSTPGRLG